MKAVRIDSREILRIVVMIFLIASLSFLQTPRLIASDDGENEDHSVFKVQKEIESVTSTLSIEKSVDKLSLDLPPNTGSEIIYTIEVEPEYGISGSITVENKSEDSIYVTEVVDVIEYHEGGPDPWKELKEVTLPSGSGPIPPKGQGNQDQNEREYPYVISFKAPENANPNQWRNIAYVTVSDSEGAEIGTVQSGPSHFRLPDSIEEVSVGDSEEVDPNNGSVGFKVTDVTIGETSSPNLIGPWTVEPPETVTIHKTVTTSAAATAGDYTLTNTATIAGGPWAQKTVVIHVQRPSSGGGEPTGGGGEQSSSGGGGGGGGGVTEQAATVTAEAAPVFSPEQVAVAPAVVSQPGSSPETVAQAKALPKKLPFTGLNFWYLSLAVLLITAGLLLQFAGRLECLNKPTTFR